MPKAGQFIKKRGLFSAHVWKMKVQDWAVSTVQLVMKVSDWFQHGRWQNMVRVGARGRGRVLFLELILSKTNTLHKTSFNSVEGNIPET